MTEYLIETIHCLGKFILYILPCVLVLLAIYKIWNVPKYIFRKLLHMIAFTCVTLIILVAENWAAVVLTSVIIMIVVYPILSLLEKCSWYDTLFVQKSPGEIKRSLLMLFGMFAILTAIGWGIFQEPSIVAASILMWGMGDAGAAIVGIPHGKHKVSFADGKKSWEGTATMFLLATISGIFVFCLYEKFTFSQTILYALLGAMGGAFVELISPSEWDTVTVPTAIMTLLFLLHLC